MKATIQTIARFLAFLGMAGLAIWSMILYDRTLAEWPELLVLTLALAALLWLPTRKIWRRLLPSSHKAIRITAHTVTLICAASFTILAGNYYCASPSTEYMETVKVDAKFRRTHHRTRRINRRVYTQGEPYYVYYITVKFDNGRTKDLQINRKLYNLVSSGSAFRLRMRKGGLGFPVIKNRNPASGMIL